VIPGKLDLKEGREKRGPKEEEKGLPRKERGERGP